MLPHHWCFYVYTVSLISDWKLQVLKVKIISRRIGERRNTCLTVWSELRWAGGGEQGTRGWIWIREIFCNTLKTLLLLIFCANRLQFEKFSAWADAEGGWKIEKKKERVNKLCMYTRVCAQKAVILNARFKLIKCTGSNRSRNYCIETADVNCKW